MIREGEHVVAAREPFQELLTKRGEAFGFALREFDGVAGVAVFQKSRVDLDRLKGRAEPGFIHIQLIRPMAHRHQPQRAGQGFLPKAKGERDQIGFVWRLDLTRELQCGRSQSGVGGSDPSNVVQAGWIGETERAAVVVEAFETASTHPLKHLRVIDDARHERRRGLTQI